MINLTTSYSQHVSRHRSLDTLITRENGSHLEIKHGGKLTFCKTTIAKREKKKKKKKRRQNETRKISTITVYSETIQPKKEKKNTVRYFIYTFTPHSYMKT